MLQLRVGIVGYLTCNHPKEKAVGYFSAKGLLFVVWFELFCLLYHLKHTSYSNVIQTKICITKYYFHCVIENVKRPFGKAKSVIHILPLDYPSGTNNYPDVDYTTYLNLSVFNA